MRMHCSPDVAAHIEEMIRAEATCRDVKHAIRQRDWETVVYLGRRAGADVARYAIDRAVTAEKPEVIRALDTARPEVSTYARAQTARNALSAWVAEAYRLRDAETLKYLKTHADGKVGNDCDDRLERMKRQANGGIPKWNRLPD